MASTMLKIFSTFYTQNFSTLQMYSTLNWLAVYLQRIGRSWIRAETCDSANQEQC